MSKETAIQWCDSSGNLQMGCAGCELWVEGKRICYAGKMTDGEGKRPGMKGRPGWPEAFDKPRVFPERLEPILKWPDLMGQERPGKPWIPSRLGRLVFLNDMGDTFTQGLEPREWFAPMLPALGESAHEYLLLTKRGVRMLEFVMESGPDGRSRGLPANVWPGVTVTNTATLARAEALGKLPMEYGGPRWLSVEPMWGRVEWERLSERAAYAVDMVIFGGESGTGPDVAEFELEALLEALAFWRERKVAVFVKQLGSRPVWRAGGARLPLKDGHGGNWEEWPKEFKVREFPLARAREPRRLLQAVGADLKQGRLL